MIGTNEKAPTNSKSHLPEGFVFSQSSLQAYVDCRRRFWLTYIIRAPWPAAPASPAAELEQLMRLGATFHRLVQRAEEGIDADTISAPLEFPLQSWYRAYSDHRPADLPISVTEQTKCVEHVLETSIGDNSRAYRLMAKYDLVAAAGDRTIVVDWKTGGKMTRPAVLSQRMQTMVYPFVLVEAGVSLPWGPIAPEQVEMRYWFAAAPQQPVVFRYDSAQHTTAHTRLHSIIAEIASSDTEADYPMVADTEFNRKYLCGFCAYRGYCDRGDRATDIVDLDDFTLDEIAEASSFLDFSLDDVDEIPH